MGHRPDPGELDKPLTREEIAERKRKLAMLSEYSVRDAYILQKRKQRKFSGQP